MQHFFPDHHGCGLDKRLLEHLKEVAREARLEACHAIFAEPKRGRLIRSSYQLQHSFAIHFWLWVFQFLLTSEFMIFHDWRRQLIQSGWFVCVRFCYCYYCTMRDDRFVFFNAFCVSFCEMRLFTHPYISDDIIWIHYENAIRRHASWPLVGGLARGRLFWEGLEGLLGWNRGIFLGFPCQSVFWDTQKLSGDFKDCFVLALLGGNDAIWLIFLVWNHQL